MATDDERAPSLSDLPSSPSGQDKMNRSELTLPPPPTATATTTTIASQEDETHIHQPADIRHNDALSFDIPQPTSPPPPIPITVAPPQRPATADSRTSPIAPEDLQSPPSSAGRVSQVTSHDKNVVDDCDKRDSGLGPSMTTTSPVQSPTRPTINHTAIDEGSNSVRPSTTGAVSTKAPSALKKRQESMDAGADGTSSNTNNHKTGTGTDEASSSTRVNSPVRTPKTATFADPPVTSQRPVTAASSERPPSRWKINFGRKSGRGLTSARSFEEPHRLRKAQNQHNTADVPNSPTESTLVSTTPPFSPLTMDFATDELLEVDALSFSKRGSMLLGGKKALLTRQRQLGMARKPSISMLATTNPRMLPDEVVKESQKVRSMYETGSGLDWEDGKLEGDEKNEPLIGSSSSPEVRGLKGSFSAYLDSTRKQHELAGGIEDWEDVEGKDVDRYGFITRRDILSDDEGDFKPPHRVSTALQLASESPRRRRTFGRTPSNARSARSAPRPQGSRKVLARSIKTQKTQNSTRSSVRAANKPFRHAANRLPGNRDRRWMDEAGDMLTLPPGLADIAEEVEGGRGVEEQKRKEWQRTEKWRKMAKIKKGKEGEGMDFEFDTTDPKLIERTWKGIPDRWRATAWYSFLSASARKHPGSPTDAELIDSFRRSQSASSADDVQIDIDVPRTINSHIMFRTRYRGGQRLLFRVLHAFSLHAADTGYVQGMASLAATLLCYFDEERAFVMLIRMWDLRGLNKLYAAGFEGLMQALGEFQQQWLSGREVAKQLDGLSIEPTAYGTRWYLTLFNYSIPFAAQLRVWDVFMLLGDADPSAVSPEHPFAGTLDVLHATAAALIDGMREILLDSDFENAMKVLTSWIPIKDEELLMRVTKAEWKLHHTRRK